MMQYELAGDGAVSGPSIWDDLDQFRTFKPNRRKNPFDHVDVVRELVLDELKISQKEVARLEEDLMEIQLNTIPREALVEIQKELEEAENALKQMKQCEEGGGGHGTMVNSDLLEAVQKEAENSRARVEALEKMITAMDQENATLRDIAKQSGATLPDETKENYLVGMPRISKLLNSIMSSW